MIRRTVGLHRPYATRAANRPTRGLLYARFPKPDVRKRCLAFQPDRQASRIFRKTMNATPETPQRELRLRIARLRRRIDQRIRGVERETRALASWRTYVSRFPWRSFAAALGIGVAASAGLHRVRWGSRLGTSLFRHSIGRLLDGLWQEALRIWRDATPSPTRRAGDSESASRCDLHDGSNTP
jgi:hypothetical protein